MDEGTLLVRAEGVSRVYGRDEAAVTVLDRVSFEVWAGDRIALVGPSGSGKSTLLHLVGALDRPTSGTIVWPALGPSDRLRPGLVGVGFQGPSLLPALTVAENVALPLLLMNRSQSEANREALRLIGRFHLLEVAAKLPEEVSGGQLQRAGLARALAGEPRLVLVDEPTGQQDRATGRLVVSVLLEEVDRTGAALVVATHDRSVAEQLAVRWTLGDGRLLREEGVASSF